MDKDQRDKLVAIGEALVATLGSMPSDQADKVVKKCAEAIYRDVLGMCDEIKLKEHAFILFKSSLLNTHCEHVKEFVLVENNESSTQISNDLLNT